MKKQLTLYRWEVALAFVLLTFAFAFGIWKVQHDSASIVQLERTNCSLKQFLLTAERARLRAAKTETGLAKRRDLSAANGYADLARRFQAVGAHCDEPVGR